MNNALWLRLGATIAWVVICSVASVGSAEEIRLRIAWGEGPARQWHGRVRIGEGAIREARGLGLTSDSPGSIEIAPDTQSAQIFLSSRQAYHGVDLVVDAPLQTDFELELVDGAGPPKALKTTLAELVVSEAGKGIDLDAQGNRLLVQRSPGDTLRFLIERQSLVFSTQETVNFEIQPSLVADGASSRLDCRVRLIRDDVEVNSQSVPVTLDEEGSGKSLPFEFKLPDREGVYAFEISLIRKSRVQLLPSRVVAKRLVQFVVIAPRQARSVPIPWSQIVGFDPARKGWLDRVGQLPGIGSLPGMSTTPLNSSDTTVTRGGYGAVTSLTPEGWVAYPLSIAEERLHRPHLLEIEYPTDQPMSLGVSIIEPERSGQVTRANAESGVEVLDRWASTDNRPERLQLVFWPRTTTPYLLLTNRGENPAAFHGIRVLAGPDNLSEKDLRKLNANFGTMQPMEPSHTLADEAETLDARLVAAFFETPDFARVFGSDEAADPARPPHGSLDDWNTFYRGAVRLAEYLRFAGYNAAVICVARDGGALYPSQILEPSPLHDSGVFFRSGQDAMQKDVLEMLFRIFDREGLRLIPALHLSGTTPALEKQRRRPEGTGIALTGPYGASRFDGRTRQDPQPAYYNASDTRVQAEIQRIVRELAERYGQHAAFAGVALQSGPDTWTQFPDLLWGVDSQSMRRFFTETRVKTPPPDGAMLYRFISEGQGRTAWLDWRSQALSRLHKRLEAELKSVQPNAKLILTAESRYRSPTIRDALRPRTANTAHLNDLSMRVGLNADLYRTQGIAMMRSYRYSYESDVTFVAEDIVLNRATSNDEKHGGLQFHHESISRAMPGFDALSPFRDARNHLRLLQPSAKSGQDARIRFARGLASLDATTLLDGGEMHPLGQENAVRPYLSLLRHLPSTKYEEAPPNGGGKDSAVVVRHGPLGASRSVYVVNQAPWPVDVMVVLDQVTLASVARIPEVPNGSIVRQASGDWIWQTTLQPFGVAATVVGPETRVRHWSTRDSTQVSERLKQKIEDVQRRIQLTEKPRQASNAPDNLSFERPGQGVPGWRFATGQGFVVERQGDGPSQVLRVANNSATPGRVLWVRSAKFQPPTTGMLAVEVRLRTRENSQPRLAVAIDTERGYYDPLFVGAGTAQQVDSKWQSYPFLFKLPSDLPQISIGFDVAEGEVWIDDIRVYDIWLEHERRALTMHSGMAKNELSQGNPYRCQQFLEEYWPRFLMQHDPANTPRAARAPEGPTRRFSLPDVRQLLPKF